MSFEKAPLPHSLKASFNYVGFFRRGDKAVGRVFGMNGGRDS